MSILPTSNSQKKVIPLNEGPSLDNIPIVDDPPVEDDSDDEEFDTTVGAAKTKKPSKVPFYEKWRRKLVGLTYEDIKANALWLVDSATIEFSISVRSQMVVWMFVRVDIVALSRSNVFGLCLHVL